MMWLRRALALPLVLIFIILFIPMLVVFRINDTVGSPDFYIDQLRKADTYNFLYDDILTAAIEEASINVDISETYISRLKPHIAPMVEETIPRTWLKTQVEQIISSALPYALGDTDGFRIYIPLKERVEASAQAVKNTLHKEGVFPDLYDQAINFVLDETASSFKELPLSKEQLKRVVNTALPAQWVLMQIDDAIDEVTLYFTGDKEHFAIHLEVSSQLDDLESVVTDILKGQDAYNYLFENVLVPALKQNIQDTLQLPLDIILTNDEIIEAAKEVLPLEWYQGQVTDVTQQVFPYLKGVGQTLELVIPLADRKPVAVGVLGELVNKKVGIDVSAMTSSFLNELVNGLVPDQWTLDDIYLRQLFGGEDILGRAREYIGKGLNYTDEDLRVSMGASYQTVEDIRQQIASGIVFTEGELRSLISGAGGEGASAQLEDFDQLRLQLGTVRRWRWTFWLIPALILLAIGALGAQKWTSKLVWGASVLTATSLIIYALFGPVFSAVVQPEVTQLLAQAAGQPQGFQALIVGKGISIAQNAVNSFIGGLKLQTLILLATSLVLITFGLVWHKVRARGPLSE